MLLAILRAKPEATSIGNAWQTTNGKLPTLSVDSLETPFPTTFEAAAERMQQLPRMFFELDGSFLFTGWQDETFWRLEGNLYDRRDALLYVELRIDSPRAPFEQLVEVIAPGSARMYELPGEGVLVSEETLLKYAFANNET